jgi:hypothetical protein
VRYNISTVLNIPASLDIEDVKRFCSENVSSAILQVPDVPIEAFILENPKRMCLCPAGIAAEWQKMVNLITNRAADPSEAASMLTMSVPNYHNRCNANQVAKNTYYYEEAKLDAVIALATDDNEVE